MGCNIEDIYNELLVENDLKTTEQKNDVLNKVITATDVKGSSTDTEYSKSSKLDEYTIKLGTDEFTKAFNDAYKVDIEKGILSDEVAFVEHSRAVVSFMSEHFATYLPETEVQVEESIVNNGTRGTNNLHKDTIEILYDEKDLMSSKSEILLHETLHTMAKDITNKDPDVFKDLTAIREALKDKLTPEVFLHQITRATGRTEFTDTEVARANEKLDYIMNDDIEEFFAYAMSNQSLFSVLANVNVKELAENSPEVDSVFKKGKKITEVLLDMLKTMLGFPQRLSTVNESDNINILLVKQIHSIAEYQAKVITAAENGIFSDHVTNMAYIGFPAKVANTSYKKLEQLDEALTNRLGMPPTQKVRQLLETMYDIAAKPIKAGANSAPVVTAIDRITQLDALKPILKSRIGQAIVREIFTDTANGKYSNFYEKIRKASYLVDSAVRQLKTSITDKIKGSKIYGEDAIPEAKVVTDSLINTGVFKKVKEVIGAYKEHGSIEEAIKVYERKVLHKLSKSQIAHIDALAKFSVTGEASIVNQQTSVQNILNNMYQHHSSRTPTQFKYDEFREVHDDLETLLSLRITKEEKALEALVSLELEAVDELLKLSEVYNSEYQDVQNITLNEDNYTAYTSLAFNYIEPDNESIPNKMSLIPLEDFEDRKDRTGLFSFANKVDISGKPIIINGKEYVKVVRKVSDVGFEEQAIKLTNTDTKGLSIKTHLHLELAREIELDETIDKDTKIKKLRAIHDIVDNIILNQSKGNGNNKSFLQLDGVNAIPSYNVAGQIVDYVLPYSKKDYSDALGASTDIMSTLPHTISRLHSIKKADVNNKQVVNLIVDFHEKNKGKIGTNGKPLVQFITVSNSSSDPDAKAAWDLLPNSLKTYIQKDLGKGGLTVPLHMLDQIFGARDPSIVNLTLGKKNLFTNITTRDTVSNIESAWKEILGKAKSMLILLHPDILSGNLISNSGVASAEGINRAKYFYKFNKYWKLLDEYQEIEQSLTALELAYREGDKSVKGKIDVTRKRLERHTVHVLVQDGQFTPFVDDVDTTDDKGIISSAYRDRISLFKGSKAGDGGADYQRELLNLKDKLKRKDPNLSDIEAELEAEDMLTKGKLPNVVGKIIDTLFVNKGTPIHSFATKFTLYGDTITRLMILDERRAESLKKTGKPLQGKELRDTLNELDMKLVNYTYLQNKYISYADKVGGVNFLKYAMRSGKGYVTTIKQDPLAVANQQALQHGLGFDVADPLDTILRNPVDTVENRLSSPVEKLEDGLTPNLFVPVTELDLNSFIKF